MRLVLRKHPPCLEIELQLSEEEGAVGEQQGQQEQEVVVGEEGEEAGDSELVPGLAKSG